MVGRTGPRKQDGGVPLKIPCKVYFGVTGIEDEA